MRLHKGKFVLALCMAILLFANPVAVAATSVTSATAITSGNASSQGFFQRSASFFGSIFSGEQSAAADDDLNRELNELAEQGLFDPLLGTLSGYFSNLLKDERLRELFTAVLEEIAEDESKANLDTNAFIMQVIRDPRLTVILGDTIANTLKDEELLTFVEKLTADVEKLLRDERFVSFFNRAINNLLEDPRTNRLIFDIVTALIAYPEKYLANLTDGESKEVILGFVDELMSLFRNPFVGIFDDLLEDPRIVDAIGNILAAVEDLPEEVRLRLFGDPDDRDNYPGDQDFLEALDMLKLAFTRSLLGDKNNHEQYPGMLYFFLQNIQNDLVFRAALGKLMDQFAIELATGEVSNALEALLSSMGDVTGSLVDGVFAGIDAYASGMPLGESGPSDNMRILVAIESEVGDYLMYFIDVAIWVLAQNMESMNAILDRYLGDDAEYLPAIVEALNAAIDYEWPQSPGEGAPSPNPEPGSFKAVLMGREADEKGPAEIGLLTEYLERPDLMAALHRVVGEGGALEETLNAALDDAMANFKGDLIFLLTGQGEVVIEVLFDMLGAILGNLSQEEVESGNIEDLLNDIASSVKLNELFDKNTVKEWVDGLFGLVDRLPLAALTPYLRENADELGYTAAESILEMVAGLLEPKDETPEDVARAAIMAMLKDENRLRQFYMDLGGTDPDKVTADSTDIQIILAVFAELVGDDARLTAFLEDLEQRSEPVVEELRLFGGNLVEVIFDGLRSAFGPYMFNVINAVTIFPIDNEPAGKHLSDWVVPESITEELQKMWFLVAQELKAQAAFVDESIASFLNDYGTTPDVATAERFSAINLFFAEIADAEELKDFDADITAAGLMDTAHSGLARMLPGIADMLEPTGLATTLNNLLGGILPEGTYRLDAGGIPVEMLADLLNINPDAVKGIKNPYYRVIEMMALSVEQNIAEIRSAVGGILNPLANLPADVLSDSKTERAVSEIVSYIPEPAVAAVAGLLADPRFSEVFLGIAESVLDEYLGAMGDMLEDERFESALEDAITRVVSDPALATAVGELPAALLSDSDLFELLEFALHQTRLITIGYPWQGIDPYWLIDGGTGFGTWSRPQDHQGNPSPNIKGHIWQEYRPGDEMWNPNVDAGRPVYEWVSGPPGVTPSTSNIHQNWRPATWELGEPLYTEPVHDEWGGPDIRVHMQGHYPHGGSNQLYYSNQYADHPYLPDPVVFPTLYQWQRQYIDVPLIGGWVEILMYMPHYWLEMGINNAMYAFTENFINWLDPERPYGRTALGIELKNTLAGTETRERYLNEERARDIVAKPLVDMMLDIARGIVIEESGIKNAVLSNLSDMLADDNPLETMASYLDNDMRLPGILASALGDLPLENFLELLRDNEDISGLLEDNFAGAPLENLSELIRGGSIQGLVRDTGANFDLSTIKPLLQVEDETLIAISERVRAFPVENVTRFLQQNNRAYRIGYTLADMESRFLVTLLENPGTAELSATLINEKVAEADYTLAASIFDTLGTIVNNERLTGYTGEKIHESVLKYYDSFKEYFRSLARFFSFSNNAVGGAE